MEVGRSVTSLEYFAWPKGPVPKALQDEFGEPKPDMQAAMEVSEKPIAKRSNKMLKIVPLMDFDQDLFSKREMRLMSELALGFRNAQAKCSLFQLLVLSGGLTT